MSVIRFEYWVPNLDTPKALVARVEKALGKQTPAKTNLHAIRKNPKERMLPDWKTYAAIRQQIGRDKLCPAQHADLNNSLIDWYDNHTADLRQDEVSTCTRY